MSIETAILKFRKFHLKEPDEIVELSVKIPKIVRPIGFCPQISYKSSKWNKDDKFVEYVHWWENPTLVCVDSLCGIKPVKSFYSDLEFNLGEKRDEVTFLGYALDFFVTKDDRSKVKDKTIDGDFSRVKEDSPKTIGSKVFEFNTNTKAIRTSNSCDYVCCSPNGRVVYVISEKSNQVFAFINDECKVTKHGIEG